MIQELAGKLNHLFDQVAGEGRVHASFAGGVYIDLNIAKLDAAERRIFERFIEILPEYVIQHTEGAFTKLAVEWDDQAKFEELVDGLTAKMAEQTRKGYEIQRDIVLNYPNAAPYFELTESGHLLFGVTIKYDGYQQVPNAFDEIARKRGSHEPFEETGSASAGMIVKEDGTVIAKGSMNMGAARKILKDDVMQDRSYTQSRLDAEGSCGEDIVASYPPARQGVGDGAPMWR